jgi:hypothetical protein
LEILREADASRCRQVFAAADPDLATGPEPQAP